MKKLPLVLVTLSFIISISSFAQVAIGTNEIEESAILQLESKEKGFLLPRMTNEERLKIDKPAVGLQIFVTDFGGTDKGMILFYDGSEWKAFKELSSRPDAPTSVTVSRSRSDNSLGEQATITFSNPENNGSTITQYQVNATNLRSGEAKQSSFNVDGSNVEVTQEQTQILIPDLETNALYTFSVAAINAVGTSDQSELSDIAPTPIAGDYLYGGVVFYILNGSDPGYVSGETHGLICAPADLELSYPWSSNQNNNVLATDQRMGYGKANTDKIIQELGDSNTAYAAYQATLYHLSEDGDDRPWYLPSKHELNKIYDVLRLEGTMNFINDNYWSSSQYNSSKASIQNLVLGTQSEYNKTTLYKVRPIRSF